MSSQLAQITYTSAELGAVMGVLLLLLTLAIAARKVFGNDPPLHRQYASREDADFLKSEIGKIDTERRTSVANLHLKIDTQLASLRIELNSKIENLEGRIDAVPQRTISLLRETKGLLE